MPHPTGELARNHRTRGARACSGQRGSATIWVLAAGALVLAVTYAAVLLAAVAAARQRAAAAADLAALAGARVALAGAGGADADPCAEATRAAALNGARLDRCTATGDGVLVRASVSLPGPLTAFGTGTVGASARAGPAAPAGS